MASFVRSIEAPYADEGEADSDKGIPSYPDIATDANE
jgi:hypothetical protein